MRRIFNPRSCLENFPLRVKNGYSWMSTNFGVGIDGVRLLPDSNVVLNRTDLLFFRR